MDKILVVDDEKGVCHSFKKILSRHNYDVITAVSGREALELVQKDLPELVILDVNMPEMDGIETLKRLKSEYPRLTIIVMTAFSTSEKAISAMKFGAFDFITKPVENKQLLSLVEKAVLAGKTSTPVIDSGLTDDKGGRIIGKSPSMLKIFKKIGQVADTNCTVLIRGESGTGKEKMARAIYHNSTKFNKCFLPINCAAIPEPLLESELFGYEKGSFTGADSRKFGKFEQCESGTMFLDEIGDMSLSLQAKVLRVLQDGIYQRIGGNDFIKATVRIIAATNKNLEELIKTEAFRDDLYWRLNVVSIHIPPLRERKDDIEDLVLHFVQRFNIELEKDIKGVSPDLLNEFKRYEWPGNVRELQSVIQRGMVLCNTDFLTLDDCEWPPQTGLAHGKSKNIETVLSDAARELLRGGGLNIYKDAVSTFERLLIKKALELNNDNQALTARMLGISRNTLKVKLDKH